MVNLSKGGSVVLSKGVKKFRVGISWDIVDGKEFDLDVLAIGLDNKTGGKAIDESHLVFYGSELKTPDGKPRDPNSSIIHSGDNRTGAGEGDDEVITVDVSKLDPRVKCIVFVVNIYEGKMRGYNFGQVAGAAARLYEGDKTVPEIVFDMNEDMSDKTCLEFCQIYEHNGEWKFKALGDANTNDLAQELQRYGIPCTGNA